MNKHDFLRDLLGRLSALPEAERDKVYAFYAEMIDDGMEDGLSEAEAVGKLGSLDEIVNRIVEETPMAVLIQSRARQQSRGRRNILLAVFGFPVWFPVLIALAAVLISLFTALWALCLALWCAFAGAAAGALGGVAGAVLLGGFGIKLSYLGAALLAAGCALLLPVCRFTTVQIARLSRLLWMRLKSGLLKNGGTIHEN